MAKRREPIDDLLDAHVWMRRTVRRGGRDMVDSADEKKDAVRNFIPSLLLGGYRSFGKAQKFERFSTISLLIGPNNSGKSNVLRFINSVYPNLNSPPMQLGQIDRHNFPNHADFRYGRSVELDAAGHCPWLDEFLPQNIHPIGRSEITDALLSALKRKAELDGTADAWFEFSQEGRLVLDGWAEAFSVIDDRRFRRVWGFLNNAPPGGNRQEHWVPLILKLFTPKMSSVSVAIIPAIRQVGAKGTESNGFSGEGLIERLARLQNPDFDKQPEKKKFERISTFLQVVTDNPTAQIEIPHGRETIVVHMDGKALPLESLGTGIHEVIILAASSTILEKTVVCMEEPEIHLNPVLQRKLVRYLSSATSNQYFIATHSAALMDTPDAEIYHVHLQDGQSLVERVTSGRGRSAVCEDLGYHPSDLLLANCLIWVEGPSDRAYMAYWISKRAPDLQEGVHFSIMFFGGRLASHLSANDLDEAVDGFISLRRLNRRAVIVMDSDRSNKAVPLNATKTRLVEEFNKGPGHAWVTEGREIENYLQPDQVKSAIEKVVPNCTAATKFGKYNNVLYIKGPSGKLRQAPKVEIAKYIVGTNAFDESRLDLRDQLGSLIKFIRDSNPSYERVTG
jgi:energy-coupling factor transporter ATP-binding protein EcfA2